MSDYMYYNRNPLRIEENDCVCRAISLATQLSYSTVEKLLKLVGKALDCDELCVCCYHYLLDDIFDFPCRDNKDSYTVGEIANDYSNNVLLIRIDGHLTCAVQGCVFDIWDCTNKIADCFWIVK